MTLMKNLKVAGAVLALSAVSTLAMAQQPTVKVGLSFSLTGQGAALGIPKRNMLSLIDTANFAGVKLETILLDDAGDPTAATNNARRLATEEKVDILVGSSITPASIAVANVAGENNVPHLAISPIPLPPQNAKWSFVLPQPVNLMADKLFAHMAAHGVKKVGFIGFSDSWGDLWVNALKNVGTKHGLTLIVEERYARPDTSVAGQALKLVAAKPDAVLVGASGTAAALPNLALRERGYKGPIYQSHGAVSRDFIRIGGKAAEGTFFVAGPAVVPELQADSALTKKPGLEFVKLYEDKFGKDSRNAFAGHMFDVFQVLKRAIPAAIKKAKPGTQEFRDALRVALESEKDIAAAHGVYNYTATDHYGVDGRAGVIISIKNGDWAMAK